MKKQQVKGRYTEKENPFDPLYVERGTFPEEGLLADLLSCFDPVAEAPPLYILASGLMLLSSVIQDRYLLEENGVKGKLNLYIVLVERGGALRAEDALTICVDMLKLLEAGNDYPFLFSSNMSLKNIFLLMAGRLKSGGFYYQEQNKGLLVYREYPDLFRHLNENREIDPKGFFIEAHDGKDNFHSISRRLGEATVKDPYINLFGSMSFEVAKKYLSKHNTFSGLLDRHLILLAKPSGKCIPFGQKADVELLKHILEKLQELVKRGREKGEILMRFSEEAARRYARWYELDREREERDDSVLSSAFSANQVHVKKLAALYQLAEDGTHEIQVENVERAILLINAIRQQRKVIIGTALSDLVHELRERLLSVIRERPGISKTDLTLQFHGIKGWSKEHRDLAIESLIEDHFVYEKVNKGRHGRHYYPVTNYGGN